jgi:replication-associated recombination protein RarA
MNFKTKYIPSSLDQVIFTDEAVKRRIYGYASGKLEGHIILYGPNGTGKTTIANLLVKQIGGGNPHIESINVDDLLAKSDLNWYLRQAASFASLTTSGKHFLILNEFDNSKKNLNKFWTALDECGSGVMVVITTNNPLNIHISIRSRFDLVEIKGVTPAAALNRIQDCLNKEGLKLPDAQVLYYLKIYEDSNDLRKYIQVADEILYLWKTNQNLPPWQRQTTSLRIV